MGRGSARDWRICIKIEEWGFGNRLFLKLPLKENELQPFYFLDVGRIRQMLVDHCTANHDWNIRLSHPAKLPLEENLRISIYHVEMTSSAWFYVFEQGRKTRVESVAFFPL